MGMQYYHEFLLPGKPITTPTAFDSMIVEDLGNNRWDSYYDRTPVIKGAADSALRYFRHYSTMHRLQCQWLH